MQEIVIRVMNVLELTSSFYFDKLYIRIDKNTLCFPTLPKVFMKHRMLIKIMDKLGKEVYSHTCKATLPLQIMLNRIKDGNYFLQIYHQSTNNLNCFIGLNASNGIPLHVNNGCVWIIAPSNFGLNKQFFEQLKSDYFHKLAYKTPTSVYHSTKPEIVEYAIRITKQASNTYQKILAIHDWVADNLFYDMDALNNGSYAYKKYDPLTLLASRRTICRGYSKLAVTLLRAIGIPAFDVLCMADGEGECQEDEANHVITFALDGNRWVIMDPTWDSVNIYKDGKFSKKTTVNVMHQYFDTTIAFISYTHKFLKY